MMIYVPRFLVLVGIFAASMTKTVACSCTKPGSVAEAYNYTEAIFYGRVIEKSFVSFAEAMNTVKLDSLRTEFQNDDQKLEFLQSASIVELRIELLEVYKGELCSDVVTVYTSRTGASCGFTDFKEGHEFIVYAQSKSHAFWIFNSVKDAEKDNTLWTNHCTRTTKFNATEAAELESLVKC